MNQTEIPIAGRKRTVYISPGHSASGAPFECHMNLPGNFMNTLIPISVDNGAYKSFRKGNPLISFPSPRTAFAIDWDWVRIITAQSSF